MLQESPLPTKKDAAVNSWRVPHEFVINPPGQFMALEAILSAIAQRLYPEEKSNFIRLEDLSEITLRSPGVSSALVMPIINYLLQHGKGSVGLHVTHQFDFKLFAQDCERTLLNSFSQERAARSLSAIGNRADKHQLVVAQMLEHPNCYYEHRRPTIKDVLDHLKHQDSIVVQLDMLGLKNPDHKIGKETKIRYTAIVTGIDIDSKNDGFVYVNLPGATSTEKSPEAHFDPVENLPIGINRFMELWCMDEGNSMPFYALGKS